MNKYWWCIALILAFYVKADWNFRSIGNIHRVHFYHEDNQIRGIGVLTEEGVIGMLDAKSGEIMWRDNPTKERSISYFIAKERCNPTYKHIDAIVMENNVTEAKLYDLKDGTVVNMVEMSKGVDAMIIDDKNLTYAIMSIDKVKIFQNNEETSTLHAKESETFAFLGYDHDRNTLIIGSINEEENKLNISLENEEQPPLSLDFTANKDMIVKTREYILVIKSSESILIHSIKDRTTIHNKIPDTFKVALSIKNRFIQYFRIQTPLYLVAGTNML